MGSIEVTTEGTRFTWHRRAVRLHLRGRFNALNALGAATLASALGLADADIVAGLEAVEAVPGRFQTVTAGQAFTVVVDYAHTPDGLAQLLAASRELVRAGGGRVVVVFGAGGDRDRAKRPLMG